MRKSLLFIALSLTALAAAATETSKTFTIDGKEYSYDLITSKQVGPGVVYNRIRIPDFPLNINYMTVDLTNPYNRIETQQASEKTGSTEKLADAYTRMQAAGKKPIGAQNGNFWVVSGQGIYSQFALGTTYNACLRNGKIVTETNCSADQWDGGPQRTGVVGMGYDKDVHIEAMKWKGTLQSPRWGEGNGTEFQLVNKYCRATGEVVLYNSFYGNTKKFQTIEETNGTWATVDNQSCEVYLKLNEGQEWTSNGDIVATVGEIRSNTTAGTLGDYDICIVGTANYKTLLEQLQVGDQVTVNYAWYSIATGQALRLEQAIGGNAMVMEGGELNGRNEDESYNSMVYSRSAYGNSQDGKTLYMFTIDKSTDPVYGESAGCNTSTMCQIMKQLGAWDVCNVDAGGSAQLMVQGSVVNKTTEGTPRAVANGWMVYSVAPDEDAQTITSLAFLDPEISAPIYSSYTPTVLGYNKYGELVSENVEGVTYTIDAAYGTVNGSVIDILGKSGTTTLTATYNDISVSKDITVKSAEVGMRLQSVLNDGRDYPIEVVSTIGFDQYKTDPSRLDWTVDNPEIAKIENGVLKGLKNGTTTIKGTLQDVSTSATVTVELPEAAEMPIIRTFPESWNVKQVGGTGLAVSQYENGFKISYTGNGSSRGAYIQIEAPLQVWSMPKALRLAINPGNTTVKRVSSTFTSADGTTHSAVNFTDAELAKNELTSLTLDLSSELDVNDVAVYPLNVATFRLDMGKSESGASFDILVPEFMAVYSDYGSVNTVTAKDNGLRIYPNPVADGVLHVAAEGEDATVEVFNHSGMLLASQPVDLSAGTATVNVASLQAGIYFLRVVTADGMKVGKFIVK